MSAEGSCRSPEVLSVFEWRERLGDGGVLSCVHDRIWLLAVGGGSAYVKGRSGQAGVLGVVMRAEGPSPS